MSSTITAAALPVFRPIATATEALASVHVGLQPADPLADTGEDLGLRWRALAARLAAQGADDATVAVIGRDLAGQPVSPARYAVFARNGSVVFRQTLPGAGGVDVARFGAPADVMALLDFIQRHPPYVRVVVDRTGADVTAVARGAVTGSTTVVVGPDDEIERNAPGGWAQARYQRRAEDSWSHNAGAVAREATRALQETDAGLLLVSGDVRGVQLLRDHLPRAVSHVDVRQLPGGRQPDGSPVARDAAIADAVAGYVDAQTTDLLDRFDDEHRRGGLAVEGVGATLRALAQRRVRTLLVVDDARDERLAWFGPDTLCADRPDAAPGMTAGRLLDVAVRAALVADAEVHVLAAERASRLPGRVGAVCRFSYAGP